MKIFYYICQKKIIPHLLDGGFDYLPTCFTEVDGFVNSDKLMVTGVLTSCCTGLFFLHEQAIILFYLFYYKYNAI